MKTAPDSQRRNYCVYRGGSVWTPNKIVLAAYATFRVPHTLRERMLISFLGAFAKLRKQTISFVMSVCPHGTTGLPLDGFSWNFYIWVFFRKCKKKKSVLIKIGKKKQRVLYMKTNIHFWSHLAQFFSEWEMFQTTVAREILYRKLEHTFYVQFTELMCQNGQLQLHVIPNFFLSF